LLGPVVDGLHGWQKATHVMLISFSSFLFFGLVLLDNLHIISTT
jgi:hypothetical protein